jgi:modulator of FtsH protease
MNNVHASLPSGDPARYTAQEQTAGVDHSDSVKRVLRNTYALLAMTLLFSAGVAVATLTLQLPAPGLIITLLGTFGLLYCCRRPKTEPLIEVVPLQN